MAFIIFPVFVLIMVIIVIISYRNLSRVKKNADQLGVHIQTLQRRQMDLLIEVQQQLQKQFPSYQTSLKEVESMLQKEKTSIKNAGGPSRYNMAIRSAMEKLMQMPQIRKSWEMDPAFKEIREIQNMISLEVSQASELYNKSAQQFNKALNKFPNNLLGGMAGLQPYDEI